MHLTYNGQLRTESDEAAIANLLRKGWEETTAPSHDAATQNAPRWVAGVWVVEDKSDAEVAILARRAARDSLRTQWLAVEPWLMGVFWPVFTSVNQMLDMGLDAAANQAVQAVQAHPTWTQEQIDVFTAMKDQFVTAITNLPALP